MGSKSGKDHIFPINTLLSLHKEITHLSLHARLDFETFHVTIPENVKYLAISSSGCPPPRNKAPLSYWCLPREPPRELPRGEEYFYFNSLNFLIKIANPKMSNLVECHLPLWIYYHKKSEDELRVNCVPYFKSITQFILCPNLRVLRLYFASESSFEETTEAHPFYKLNRPKNPSNKLTIIYSSYAAVSPPGLCEIFHKQLFGESIPWIVQAPANRKTLWNTINHIMMRTDYYTSEELRFRSKYLNNCDMWVCRAGFHRHFLKKEKSRYSTLIEDLEKRERESQLEG